MNLDNQIIPTFYILFFLILIINLSHFVDFGSLFDLEHDLPDELISSSELNLANGGDLSQLHTSLGGGGGAVAGVMSSGQDAAAKHKQLSELLRHVSTPGAPQQQQQGAMGGPAGTSMGLFGNMKASPGPQGMGTQVQQHLSSQHATLMQQQQMAGMVGNMNRNMLGPQKGNGQQQAGGPSPQQQNMMGGQMMNGSPRMGHHNPGMGSNSNLLAEALQQQQTTGAQGGLRAPQPGAMNKVIFLDDCAHLVEICRPCLRTLLIFLFVLVTDGDEFRFRPLWRPIWSACQSGSWCCRAGPSAPEQTRSAQQSGPV